MFSVILDYETMSNLEVCGLVQTEPLQSKTGSRWSSPVQPSIWTGLD